MFSSNFVNYGGKFQVIGIQTKMSGAALNSFNFLVYARSLCLIMHC
jgi:hypothetical protein